MRNTPTFRLLVATVAALGTHLGAASQAAAQGGVIDASPAWKKHVVHEGFHTNTAHAADFTGDGKVDIVASSGGKVRLFTAPEWKESILYVYPGVNRQCIHSEVYDVDGDGDPDYMGAHSKGPVFWLENPGRGLADGELWKDRIVDDKVAGIHCLLKADVDGDGREDLLVNSFDPEGPVANSLTWQKLPDHPRDAARWERNVFAAGDAPGGSHYFGFGDVDGDGDGDVSVGAKGDPFEGGNWFAWWKNPGPNRAQGPWEKVVLATEQLGATNIIPAELNGDGTTDFLASRGHGKGVLWFEGTGSGFTLHEIHADLEGPHCLAVADLDGDGDLDGATCAKETRWTMWYRNDGKGNFENIRLDEDQAAYDIRAIDIDGDTDIDLLVAGQRSKNVVWYENPLK